MQVVIESVPYFCPNLSTVVSEKLYQNFEVLNFMKILSAFTSCCIRINERAAEVQKHRHGEVNRSIL
jgi:hypothetical protein